MIALTQPIPQVAQIEEAIESVPLPKGVRLREVVFDTDFAGDPAIRVFFAVSRKNPLTAARIRLLAGIHSKVADVLRPLNTGALAYVRFVDVA